MTDASLKVCGRCAAQLAAVNVFCTRCGSVLPALATEVRWLPPVVPAPLPVSLSESELTSEGALAITPAPVAARLASWVIDLAVIVVAWQLVSGTNGILGAATLFVAAPAYYTFGIARLERGTLGHRLLGLSVIDDRSGERLDLRRAAMRCAVGAVLFVPWAVGAVLSAIGMARGKPRRAWHDHASQAMVVGRF